MRKIRFTNKETGATKDVISGNVGENVFVVTQNVKETNDAIRWCNTHKVGDKFDCDAYTLEIIEG
jgi:hypothetical protein